MRHAAALLLGAVSAYALSFSLDLLVGGVTAAYPSTAFLPVVTWALIAAVAGVVGVYLAPSFRWLVLPFLLIAMLAMVGGMVGHRYSLAVCAGVLAQAAVVWGVTASPRPTG